MHSQWQDLIAFYIAGTLPPADAAALEQHLAHCAACRTALEEWRLIAGVVHTEAETWARAVPLLSPAIHVQAAALPKASTNGHRLPSATGVDLSQTIVSRRYHRPAPAVGRFTLPLTLAAAVAVVVLAGALLLILANRDNADPASGSMANNVSPEATLGAAVSTAPQAIAQAPTSTQWDLGILAPSAPPPTLTPPVSQPSPVPITPGGTPTASGMGGGGPIAPMIETCSVHSATGANVPAYRWPGRSYDIIGALEPGEYLPVIVQSGTGWYQIVPPGGGLGGWVSADEVTLSGPCDDLWTPTPTLVSPDGPTGCVAAPRVTDGTFTVYDAPGRQYNSITSLSQPVPVTARTQTNWFQVQVSSDLTGWASGQDINIYGFCDNLPVLQGDGSSTP